MGSIEIRDTMDKHMINIMYRQAVESAIGIALREVDKRLNKLIISLVRYEAKGRFRSDNYCHPISAFDLATITQQAAFRIEKEILELNRLHKYDGEQIKLTYFTN